MMLFSSSEPPSLVALGTSSSIPETYGADVLVPSPSGFLIGVQRKEFPNDFMSSLTDGRLATSCSKLKRVDMAMLLLEGQPNWTATGQLLGHDYGQASNFYRAQLRALIMSMQWQFGISAYWTDSLADTAEFLRDIARWSAKDRHDSLLGRPGIRSVKLRPTKEELIRDRSIHILQGFDGIGPKLASDIYDHFGGLPLRWDVTIEQLKEVSGIGEGRAKKLMREMRR